MQHVGLKFDHLSFLIWSKMRYLVLSKQGLEPRVLPWQDNSGYQFVSYLTDITEFEWRDSNIPRDILDFVIYILTITTCDVINPF